MAGIDQMERNDGGVRMHTVGAGLRLRNGREVLRGVTLDIPPGRLVGIAGGSGAGKTLLLETLAGLRRPGRGLVRHDGLEPAEAAVPFGFVPQDDILHRGLGLRRGLWYAARLRGADPGDVDRVLDRLGLGARAAQRVDTLSGGERKRAGIAVELLSRPRALFLDEPTSGLDPATGATLMETLTELAAGGVTVVLTTHSPADLARCDLVVFLTPEGALAHAGTPEETVDHFGAEDLTGVYAEVAALPAAPEPAPAAAPQPRTRVRSRGRRPGPGPLTQWLLLTRRGGEILLRDRLSAAIVAGSPLMIVAMFALLFRPGVFDPARPSPSAAAMVLFWIGFGAFFFGLAYGLLQICGELAVVRRERLTTLRLGPYVASKITLLLPVLALADAALLAVLRALDRLPDAGLGVYSSLLVTSVLASAAGLALGLLTSAAVSDPGQAALMLPLLCFPQVLFSGAFVPVPLMAAAGQWLSAAMTNRWAFEALGAGAGLEALWAGGGSPLGPPLLTSYGDSFSHEPWSRWLLLAAFTTLFLLAAHRVLDRRCPTVSRPVLSRSLLSKPVLSTSDEG
ncbi:ATP-binding cassette domain-containing protein [Streptomyces sp. NPDC057638]|uniref:ATP-binding cassette domain-containing protein n=1 Tax=Streptomyces sp. NPDC057638 TaxID=3346190 RepID=UPI003684F71B